MRLKMHLKMSSNPKRPHFSRQMALLFTGLAGLGFSAFVGCTRSLYVGSATASDLNPGQPDSGSRAARPGPAATPGLRRPRGLLWSRRNLGHRRRDQPWNGRQGRDGAELPDDLDDARGAERLRADDRDRLFTRRPARGDRDRDAEPQHSYLEAQRRRPRAGARGARQRRELQRRVLTRRDDPGDRRLRAPNSLCGFSSASSERSDGGEALGREHGRTLARHPGRGWGLRGCGELLSRRHAPRDGRPRQRHSGLERRERVARDDHSSDDHLLQRALLARRQARRRRRRRERRCMERSHRGIDLSHRGPRG